jgi:hypothetical protein
MRSFVPARPKPATIPCSRSRPEPNRSRPDPSPINSQRGTGDRKLICPLPARPSRRTRSGPAHPTASTTQRPYGASLWNCIRVRAFSTSTELTSRLTAASDENFRELASSCAVSGRPCAREVSAAELSRSLAVFNRAIPSMTTATGGRRRGMTTAERHDDPGDSLLLGRRGYDLSRHVAVVLVMRPVATS